MPRSLQRCAPLWLLVATAGCAASPPDDAAWLILDPDTTVDAGRRIGWNLGRGTLYGPGDDPLHPAWRTDERTAAVTRLAEIRAPGGPAPWVRFSGLQIDGALGGDGYHFWDVADPDHTPTDADNMAPFQYMALVEELGAEPLVTLNFGSGTAGEAADYVTHLAGEEAGDPLVAARGHWGHPAPYAPGALELGNEVYGYWNTGYSDGGDYSYANPDAANGGDPAWHGQPSSDPADYAARALAYVEAVTAVFPDATFWFPLAQADLGGWGGLDTSLPALEPLLLHPAVTAVVVHHYQLDDAVTAGAADYNDPDLVLAGTALFEPRFADLRQRLDAMPRDAPLQLAITEYHVAGFFAGAQFELGETAAVGLGLADMMIGHARWDVDHACQHIALAFEGDDTADDLLVEPWYNPLRPDGDGGVVATPSYTVPRLVAEHTLARRAALEVAQLPMASHGGALPFEYAVVHAVAFVDEAGTTATVVALHRDRGQSRAIWIDLPDGWFATGALQYAPEAWDLDVADGDVPVEEITWNKYRGAVEVLAPPSSVTALRLQR